MRKLFQGMDKPLLITTIIMLIFGLLMIFSASNPIATVLSGNTYIYLIKQGLFIVLGIFLFLYIVKTPTKKYYSYSLIALGILMALLLGLDIFGTATRSAKSWIPVGPMNIQPSEFIKMAIIMYMAVAYERIITRNKNDRQTALKPLLIGLACFVLTAIQPDYGTAMIILGMIVLIFHSLPLDQTLKKDIEFIGFVIAAGIVTIVLLASLTGHNILGDKSERFNILEPCTRYQESSGYQVCNGYIAINNGGLTGVGLGNSTQKYLYLPEAHTDFIFPVIVEEWGIIGGIIVLLMYFFIIYRIIRISRRSVSLRGSILTYGVATYLVLHIFVNLGGVLGIFPLTGVPLPFLSYGGSNLWTLIIGLAIVQRVEIERTERIRQNILKKSLI